MLDAAEAPMPPDVGIVGPGMVAPTIAEHGSEEQRRRYLRPLFCGEEIWCQLFSEPGAGSDIAGLATSAVAEGGRWRLNGQKLWTSLADRARFGLLAARTDPDQPKHKGITCFVLDMHQPGVTVTPLRQLTGDAEFSEVSLDGAEVPDDERLGAVNDGWRVMLTTLMNERAAIGGRRTGPRSIERLLALARSGNPPPAVRERVADCWIAAESHRFLGERAAAARTIGTPGPEAAVEKLAMAMINQRIHEVGLELLGPRATLWRAPGEAGDGAPDPGSDFVQAFLRSRANTIEGGTSQVLRNVLAERVLGMPGEPRSDRDIPWCEVPR
jgi:alkylation response protein AidB-like acyl-CoA dehydrogenase